MDNHTHPLTTVPVYILYQVGTLNTSAPHPSLRDTTNTYCPTNPIPVHPTPPPRDTTRIMTTLTGYKPNMMHPTPPQRGTTQIIPTLIEYKPAKKPHTSSSVKLSLNPSTSPFPRCHHGRVSALCNQQEYTNISGKLVLRGQTLLDTPPLTGSFAANYHLHFPRPAPFWLCSAVGRAKVIY